MTKVKRKYEAPSYEVVKFGSDIMTGNSNCVGIVGRVYLTDSTCHIATQEGEEYPVIEGFTKDIQY